MFGTNMVTKSLSLGKILGGISKGLTIANQAIPIVQEIKPMLSNAKSIISLAKEFKSTPSKEVKKEEPKKTNLQEIKKEKVSSNSLPVFFQ